MGRSVVLQVFPPRRIVSLVPSQTELLFDLGLDTAVVGITKFCVRPPEWFQHKKRVGGTKTVCFEKVTALAPDLIIGNKEENDREQIEHLAARFPVWMSDVSTLDHACAMMLQIGMLTATVKKAKTLVRKMERRFAQLALPPGAHRPQTAYFVWRKPFMVAAGGTFIDAMLGWAGFSNVFGDLQRYPEVSQAELAVRNPELILLASEPYPFAEKHVPAFREICPKAQVRLVDGELFSWYGSRLQDAPAGIRQLRESIHLTVP